MCVSSNCIKNFQYARYAALATGLTYGIARHAYLTRSEAAKLKLKKETDAENAKFELIQNARNAYAKLTAPPPNDDGGKVFWRGTSSTW